MPTLNLGRVKAPPFVPRGAWDSGTAYVINDLVVAASGDTFAAVADNTAEDPDDALGSWVLFAAGGEAGAPGTNGSDATVNATNVASVITGATEKTTPVDADQLAITDSAASGALKRLTFANLWEWVKSKIDGNLTLAGTKTFSGQTELTGQAATNETSAMTRALGDSRYLQRIAVVAESDESRTPNTTTYQDDSVLIVTLDVGRWIVEADVLFANNDDVCGARVQLAFSGTMDTAKSPVFAHQGTSTGSNEINANTAGTRPVGVLGVTMPRVIIVAATARNAMLRVKHSVLVTVAGNYRIQWGQGTASATSPTIRKSGSFLVATKI